MRDRSWSWRRGTSRWALTTSLPSAGCWWKTSPRCWSSSCSRRPQRALADPPSPPTRNTWPRVGHLRRYDRVENIDRRWRRSTARSRRTRRTRWRMRQGRSVAAPLSDHPRPGGARAGESEQPPRAGAGSRSRAGPFHCGPRRPQRRRIRARDRDLEEGAPDRAGKRGHDARARERLRRRRQEADAETTFRHAAELRPISWAASKDLAVF